VWGSVSRDPSHVKMKVVGISNSRRHGREETMMVVEITGGGAEVLGGRLAPTVVAD
jgi:hypothetical protein